MPPWPRLPLSTSPCFLVWPMGASSCWTLTFKVHAQRTWPVSANPLRRRKCETGASIAMREGTRYGRFHGVCEGRCYGCLSQAAFVVGGGSMNWICLVNSPSQAIGCLGPYGLPTPSVSYTSSPCWWRRRWPPGCRLGWGFW